MPDFILLLFHLISSHNSGSESSSLYRTIHNAYTSNPSCFDDADDDDNDDDIEHSLWAWDCAQRLKNVTPHNKPIIIIIILIKLMRKLRLREVK